LNLLPALTISLADLALAHASHLRFLELLRRSNTVLRAVLGKVQLVMALALNPRVMMALAATSHKMRML
jgi:hypothetical protein